MLNGISADESNYDDSLLNEPITEEEIIIASKKLKNNKSPGVDNIVNEYIKASIMPMMKCYVGLFNKILDSGVFPEAWSFYPSVICAWWLHLTKLKDNLKIVWIQLHISISKWI